MNKKPRSRGLAFSGRGYGTLRLLRSARDHIERSLAAGFYCEAITIIESVITDRLESRTSWLTGQDIGFRTLGWLINNLRGVETDNEMLSLLNDLDRWRERRNGAIHELVKIEAGRPLTDWSTRLRELSLSANDGYELLKRLYHAVADRNPRHRDRVFPRPPLPRRTAPNYS